MSATNENPLHEDRSPKAWWERIKTPASHRVRKDGVQSESLGGVVREGDLVRLRRHTEANRAAFQRWYADHDIAQLLRHDLRPLTHVQSLIYFDTVILPSSARGYTCAIHDRATDELIGTTGLTDLELRATRSCFFRIVIGESRFWNRGYGTEATRLMMLEAFEQHSLDHVNLEVFDYNQRAINTYERVGFVRTGEHIEWPGMNERELHVIEMRLTRDAYVRNAG